MPNDRYFLICEWHGFSADKEEHGVDALTSLDDLSEEDAKRIQDAIDLQLEQQDIGTYMLIKEDDSPESLLYRVQTRAREGRNATVCSTAGSEYERIASIAESCADLIRSERKHNQNNDPQGQDRPTRFEVFDRDYEKKSYFDSTGTQHWGPWFDGEDWNGEYFVYSVQSDLYRHPTGHWTLIEERTHCEAPCSCGADARRISNSEAASWLSRNGYEVPTDIAQIVDNLTFQPGVPLQKNMPTVIEDDNAHMPKDDKPTWNKDRSMLFYGDQIIKRIRSISVAKNVVRVLDAFEEENWPDKIDDPLDPSKDQKRLHETIKRLNDNLTVIRFRADGTGQGILWERLQPPRNRPETAPGDTEIPF